MVGAFTALFGSIAFLTLVGVGLFRVSQLPAVSSPIEFLDFADEQAFVNAASHLVAVLTATYPFTAVLVDAASAKQHLVDSLADSALP